MRGKKIDFNAPSHKLIIHHMNRVNKEGLHATAWIVKCIKPSHIYLFRPTSLISATFNWLMGPPTHLHVSDNYMPVNNVFTFKSYLVNARE